MIRVSNIRNADTVNYDEVWVIMRSAKYASTGYRHVPQLSPSSFLFQKYLMMRDMGVWDIENFKGFYVPTFLREMHRSDARYFLNCLWYLDSKGKNIQVCCSCVQEEVCHRSIVGGVLEGIGCNVVYDSGNSYKFYYDSYKEVIL